MGIMGPLLRAEVGDTIRVTFKNSLKDHAGEPAQLPELPRADGGRCRCWAAANVAAVAAAASLRH